MTDRNFEGQLRVLWAPDGASPGVDDLSAPTVAEVGAAEDITPYLPTAGVSIEGTENNSSLAMLDSGFVSESVGTEGASLSLTFKRDDDPDEDPFFLFSKNDTGTLIVVPFGGGDYTAAADDKVETYQVEAHTPRPLTPAENTKQQCIVTFAVGARDLDATVAASA